MENLVAWFEIPVTDMDRAIAFYRAVFGWDLEAMASGPRGTGLMALFPFPEHRAGGALIWHEGYEAGDRGTVIYLYAGKDLSGPLGRVEEAGGQILMGKTSVGEHGYTAWILDSEGNRIGLHSEF